MIERRASYDEVFRWVIYRKAIGYRLLRTVMPFALRTALFLPPILCRVFAAVVFTALQLGRASSFAPDVSKAKVSAARILALLKYEPPIDTESPDGLKPVGTVSFNWAH